MLAQGLDPVTAPQQVQQIAAEIGGTPGRVPGSFSGGLDGVAYAVPQVLPDGTTALVSVIPETGPQD